MSKYYILTLILSYLLMSCSTPKNLDAPEIATTNNVLEAKVCVQSEIDLGNGFKEIHLYVAGKNTSKDWRRIDADVNENPNFYPVNLFTKEGYKYEGIINDNSTWMFYLVPPNQQFVIIEYPGIDSNFKPITGIGFFLEAVFQIPIDSSPDHVNFMYTSHLSDSWWPNESSKDVLNEIIDAKVVDCNNLLEKDKLKNISNINEIISTNSFGSIKFSELEILPMPHDQTNAYTNYKITAIISSNHKGYAITPHPTGQTGNFYLFHEGKICYPRETISIINGEEEDTFSFHFPIYIPPNGYLKADFTFDCQWLLSIPIEDLYLIGSIEFEEDSPEELTEHVEFIIDF